MWRGLFIWYANKTNLTVKTHKPLICRQAVTICVAYLSRQRVQQLCANPFALHIIRDIHAAHDGMPLLIRQPDHTDNVTRFACNQHIIT